MTILELIGIGLFLCFFMTACVVMSVSLVVFLYIRKGMKQ
jgi:isoprenylcysteine carboxyl methyltransferase (ICMT) family protein YpbQ